MSFSSSTNIQLTILKQFLQLDSTFWAKIVTIQKSQKICIYSYCYRDIISKLKPYQKPHTQQRWSWIHTQGNMRLRGAFQSFWNYCLWPWTLRILLQSHQMVLGVDTLEIFQMENGMEWWIKLSMKELTLVNVHCESRNNAKLSLLSKLNCII